MRYKNIKTGAIIDSPSKIIGKAWELVGEVQKVSKQQEQPDPVEEYVEEEVNLEEMTNKELEAFAKEHGVELTTEDKKNKDSRIKAIAKAFE